MDVEKVLQLTAAGFTADEIRQMMKDPVPAPAPAPASDPTPAPDPSPAPAADPAATPETKPAAAPDPSPAPDPLADIRQQLSGLTDVVDKISKSIVMPNMDDVKPVGIEDIITNFFKED